MPKGAGAIKFEDPRLGYQMAHRRGAPMRRRLPRLVSVAAHDGDLVLFESWAAHEVPPAHFSAKRISISFNYACHQGRAAEGTKMRLIALVLLLVSAGLSPAQADELPIFDAHMHYSHDAWTLVPPLEVIEILKKAGIKRAMVSSSNTRAPECCRDVAPDLIVPGAAALSLAWRDLDLGQGSDANSVPEDLLSKRKYRAIGEFHIYGADADLPNVRRVVELAKQYVSICTRTRTPMP